MDCGLAFRVHLGAGLNDLNDIAHDHGPYLLRTVHGGCDSGLDGRRFEIGRRYVLQAPPKVPIAVRTGLEKGQQMLSCLCLRW